MKRASAARFFIGPAHDLHSCSIFGTPLKLL